MSVAKEDPLDMVCLSVGIIDKVLLDDSAKYSHIKVLQDYELIEISEVQNVDRKGV